MRQYKMLVLTDHTGHSIENSLYPLVHSIRQHPRCRLVDVASRGLEHNDGFFKNLESKYIWASPLSDDFAFSSDGIHFRTGLRKVPFSEYDLIWLRLPPPFNKAFVDFLIKEFSYHFIFNTPLGIYETGSKLFLMRFQKFCPPMRVCTSLESIIAFKEQFPIVLKPFREYGGKGIIRIDGNKVWEGKTQLTFDEFKVKLKRQRIEYLGVKFLKNVIKGDKRIIVINERIMGASLRLPPKNSWLCNVSMGGSSTSTEVDDDEREIIKTISPVLAQMGIVIYGVDTLMGDDGKRVLSEINTTSVGGLPQIEQQTGEPKVKQATDLIWDYIIENTSQIDVPTNT